MSWFERPALGAGDGVGAGRVLAQGGDSSGTGLYDGRPRVVATALYGLVTNGRSFVFKVIAGGGYPTSTHSSRQP